MDLRKWIEPRSSDDRVARQEQLVNILSLAAGVFALLYVGNLIVVSVLSGQGVHIASFLGGALAVLLSFGSYALSRSGRVRAAALAVTAAAMIVALYSGYVRGTMSVSAIMLTLAVLFAGLAVGGPAGVIAAMIELALYALLTLAQVHDWLPKRVVPPSPETGMVLVISCLGLIALSIWLTIRAFEAVIRKSAERGQRLQSLADDKDRLLDELRAREEVQSGLLETVRELGSPVIPLAPGIIALPLIGSMDGDRVQEAMSALLRGVSQHRASVAIVDITGVAAVDTVVAAGLLKAAQGIRLLGAIPVLTGIRAEVAQTLVVLGLELGSVVTKGTLEEGLAYALNVGGTR